MANRSDDSRSISSFCMRTKYGSAASAASRDSRHCAPTHAASNLLQRLVEHFGTLGPLPPHLLQLARLLLDNLLQCLQLGTQLFNLGFDSFQFGRLGLLFAFEASEGALLRGGGGAERGETGAGRLDVFGVKLDPVEWKAWRVSSG